MVKRLIAALEPDEVVLGGGNVKKPDALTAGTRAGDNDNAFRGGFRLWEKSTTGTLLLQAAPTPPLVREESERTTNGEGLGT